MCFNAGYIGYMPIWLNFYSLFTLTTVLRHLAGETGPTVEYLPIHFVFSKLYEM